MGRKNFKTQGIWVKVTINGIQYHHFNSIPHTELPNTYHKTKALKNLEKRSKNKEKKSH